MCIRDRPWNNYSWSKLGGECAVQMYKNSLIIRLCMTERPFVHSKAYANVMSNFIYQEDAAKIILKILTISWVCFKLIHFVPLSFQR